MGRCHRCGKENREGAVFCQSCGARLAPEAPAKADGVTCPACGVSGPAGMRFCRMCGTPLPAGGTVPQPVVDKPSARTPAAGAPRTNCPNCGKATPIGFAFCQHCGGRVAPAPVTALAAAAAGAAVAAEAGLAQTIAAQRTPRPSPSAIETDDTMPPPAPVSPAAALPSTLPLNRRAPTAGAGGDGAGAPIAPIRGNGTGAVAAASRAAPVAAPAPAPAPAAIGRLVVLRRDLTDGETHAITSNETDVGRSDGAITFPQDLFLAPRHMRVVRRDTGWFVHDLGTPNGVYLRVREGVVLSDGDQFLVGKQVLRFEVCGESEREPRPAMQHGVLLFGTPARAAWGRLRQITTAGITRDVFHLSRPEVVIGREEGDLRFHDDEFMSRRHAQVRFAAGTATLSDLGSSNGTFLQVRGERPITPGDLLRVGDQVLRLED